MTSPQRRKGSHFERDVVAYFQNHGFPFVERAYGAGRPDDRGDIDGLEHWTLECKNHARLALAEWCDEAEAERLNGRRRHWAVIFKRRRKPIANTYVLMDLETFAHLVSGPD
jgi:Holliday junction resolvase